MRRDATVKILSSNVLIILTVACIGPAWGQNRDSQLSLFIGLQIHKYYGFGENPLSLFLGFEAESLRFWGLLSSRQNPKLGRARSLKVMLPPRARAIFWNMHIKIDVWIWGRFFILRRFSLEVSSKMECARTRFLRQSNSLELCPDWPEKRPSKSIYKTNEILTFWLQRPSDVAIRVSRSCFFFLLKWCKSTSENPFSEGEAYFWRCHNAFGATLTDVSWKMHMFFLWEFQ